MTGEELADSLQLEGDVRDLFLLRLHGTQVKWEALKGSQYPNNTTAKRKLESYWRTMEKLLELAQELPPNLIEIEHDPGSDDWRQAPPQIVDYLEYALQGSKEYPDTIEELVNNAAGLLRKMPKTATHHRDVLLNNLEELFRIAYPEIELKLYRDNYGKGYDGGFYSFLADALPLIDTDTSLVQTISERFIRRREKKSI